MIDKLLPCACGKIPSSLNLYEAGSAKWAFASGSCCGEWHIEFRTGYYKLNTQECMDRAIAAWQAASRRAVPDGIKIAHVAANMLESLGHLEEAKQIDRMIAAQEEG